MKEYAAKYHGTPYEDIVRPIAERERTDSDFAWAEKVVDDVFEGLGVKVLQAAGLSYGGESALGPVRITQPPAQTAQTFANHPA